MNRTFDPETTSVREARAFVLDAAGDLPVDPQVLELLVSELASNAVLHARSPFEVAVTNTPDVVRVAVRDESAAMPEVQSPDQTATTGRGLRIVERLARAWGVDRLNPGKAVWFELALDPVDG
jgi:anti-sigma regulatory factor (Ser/Thr protein kinase)